MLSRAQIKYIRSLTQQKYRKEHQVFIAEGDKISREWLASGRQVELIVGTEPWIAAHTALIGRHPESEVYIVSESVLASVSALQTPNQVLLVAALIPQPGALPDSGRILALDQIRDPGNMGTLLRIADWFGIPSVVCAPDCVDVYNPKVVQAAMGAHLRVQTFETELEPWLSGLSLPVVAATLHGKALYECEPLFEGVLLIGNESRGIGPTLIRLASQQVTIPGKGGAESLNAAVSAGILCAHFFR